MPVTWTVLVLGAAMIVYTVRGGVSAVIWTDVVQMFVYVGGALLVFFGLLQLIPGGWGEVARRGARRSSRCSTSARTRRRSTRSGPGSSAASR